MKRIMLAASVALATLTLAAPAHAQYTGGGSTAMPSTDTMDPTALYKQAVGYIQEKKFASAIPLLRDVLASRDGDPAANLMMGVAQLGLNDLWEAHRFLTRATSEKPDLADAIGRLGWVESRLGNAGAAAKQRSILVGLKEKCKGACPEASAIDSGLALIDGAGGKQTISAAARYNQGIDFINAKSWSEAVAAFNDVITAKPDDFEAAYLKGQAQVGAGDYAGAKTSLEAALKIQPGLVDAKGRLGWVEKKLGHADAAAAVRAGLVSQQEKCGGTCAGAKQITDAIAMIDSAK